MNSRNFGRRDFHKLSMAALGGALAGAALSGCKSKNTHEHDAEHAATAGSASLLLSEPHVCRGLNTCKGMGAGGNNECAGAGNCATAKSHSCQGMNDCKGSGGCGATAGTNDCPGKGGCQVPLKADAWAKVRPAFEKAAKEAGTPVKPAPKS